MNAQRPTKLSVISKRITVELSGAKEVDSERVSHNEEAGSAPAPTNCYAPSTLMKNATKVMQLLNTFGDEAEQRAILKIVETLQSYGSLKRSRALHESLQTRLREPIIPFDVTQPSDPAC